MNPLLLALALLPQSAPAAKVGCLDTVAVATELLAARRTAGAGARAADLASKVDEAVLAAIAEVAAAEGMDLVLEAERARELKLPCRDLGAPVQARAAGKLGR